VTLTAYAALTNSCTPDANSYTPDAKWCTALADAVNKKEGTMSLNADSKVRRLAGWKKIWSWQDVGGSISGGLRGKPARWNINDTLHKAA